MTGPDRLVDARGMHCPWPVLRLARVVRETVAPARICVLADDPAAAGELAQLCSENGWSFARDGQDPHRFRVVIR